MEEKIRLSILLKIVNNLFERQLNNKVALMDLTYAQCQILAYLHTHRNEEIYLNDIEKKFCLKRPTVSGLTKRLEEKGFVSIEPKLNDRRYKRISLTDRSKEIIEIMEENLIQSEKILYKNLTDKDLNEFQRILTVMFNNMRKV